jgi:hypothetical protein
MDKNIHGYFISFLLQFVKEFEKEIQDERSGLRYTLREKKLFNKTYALGIKSVDWSKLNYATFVLRG